MLSFTRIARGNFRTLYTGILPVTVTLRSTATVMFGATVSNPVTATARSTATATVRAKVSTALPLLLGVPRATARVTARARATRNR